MEKIKSWITDHKLEFILLILILAIGAFMRLYKISGYMTFLGDEGRDVIIVKRLLTEFHPPLIGPGTSIGNMYLGPAYYYMMALPLLLANFNPVGPAIFIALLSILTIFFIWYVAREWFPSEKVNWGALTGALLYAISPVVIIYSRSSWNPNIMPFFALLTIYSAWKSWQSKNYKWLIVAGISFACVLQSHYLGLLLFPTILIIWLLTYIKSSKKKFLIVNTTIGTVIFLLLMSPLVIFDYRHGWHNFAAIKDFFATRQTTVSIKPWNAIPELWPLLNNVTTRLLGGTNMAVGAIIAGIFLLSLVYVYLIKKEAFKEKNLSVLLTITMWIGFGLLGMGLYKQHIYDHYFGFVFAVPFIAFGGVINKFYKNKALIIPVTVALFLLVIINLNNSPLKFPPNNQLERTQVVARKILEIANNKKFNFALIAENNYDSAYRYYLNQYGAKTVDIDPGNTKDTVMDTLLVVCEKEKTKCDPTHNPKTEISHFGMSKITETWDNVYGVTIFRLEHSK
jgi:Dolichyl-phosphate-mannose-protein mannosyltransferase